MPSLRLSLPWKLAIPPWLILLMKSQPKLKRLPKREIFLYMLKVRSLIDLNLFSRSKKILKAMLESSWADILEQLIELTLKVKIFYLTMVWTVWMSLSSACKSKKILDTLSPLKLSPLSTKLNISPITLDKLKTSRMNTERNLLLERKRKIQNS